MPGPVPPQRVLIVGAGEFGSTTALALAEGPYKGHGDLITVIDRGEDGNLAVDAASSDYNKIVRADYSDPIYQRLALEAIEEWRKPRFSPFYVESGVVVCCSTEDPQINYVRTAHRLNKGSNTADVSELCRGKEIKGLYAKGVVTGDFEGTEAYTNRVGGWAASRDAVIHTLDLARQLGVKVLSGEADSLITATSSRSTLPLMRGVRLVDGRTLEADVTILACGSWTPRLLPELATNCLPTGQVVATIMLNEEEMKRYKDMPVSFFMESGFYIFPPKPDGTLKMAIHDRGWLAPSCNLPSLPRTKLCPGYENQEIPDCALAAIKAGCARVHPELAPLLDTRRGETRMCWYSDRECGDFLLDYHPNYAEGSLFVAAGGSGHLFKFAVLSGGWVRDRLAGTLDPELTRLWSFYGDKSRLDKSRGEGPIVRRDLDTGKVAMVKVPDQEIIRAKL
ncbi:hypothetical protein JCM8547_007652 [Rhodosporidiobolus lusitaniae]